MPFTSKTGIYSPLLVGRAEGSTTRLIPLLLPYTPTFAPAAKCTLAGPVADHTQELS